MVEECKDLTIYNICSILKKVRIVEGMVFMNNLYWIWLTSKYGITPNKITDLLSVYNSIDCIYEEKTYDKINLSSNDKKLLLDKSLEGAKEILDKTEKLGGRVITYDSENYPDKLRNITPPPYILYVRGEIENIDNILTIGVVGTREATDYGKLATNRIASDLAKKGVVIVSGMARGIDSIAAKAALRQGGKTIAVLGSGLDIVYPPENKNLMDDIIKHGMVITEYPLSSRPLKTHFPERNRIIAGLSNGVLVTDAPRYSGSLITANIAMENGRDVFSVPGNIFKSEFYGNNNIIQKGAKLVMSADDIIEEYPYAVLEKTDNKAVREEIKEKVDINSEKYKNLSSEDKKIVELLFSKDMNVDELSVKSSISIGDLNVKMTLLEMQGIIKKMPGNNYALKTE